MDRPRMRPRFVVELPPGGEPLLQVLERRLRAGTEGVRGYVHHAQAELHVRREDERYFSPVLNLTLLEENGRLVLTGRFSPHPQVWTLFMGIYFVLTLVGLGGLMWGAGQWVAQETPWALVGAPLALAVGGFVYGGAFIGQGLSAGQMYDLRAYVDRAVAECSTPPALSTAT